MKMQLNALAAALAVGIFWGVCLFVWTFFVMKWPVGMEMLEMMEGYYPGYGISAQGAFLGLVWGFLDGFIGTYILVWLYNFFLRKLAK